jgi:hypothetical protein
VIKHAATQSNAGRDEDNSERAVQISQMGAVKIGTIRVKTLKITQGPNILVSPGLPDFNKRGSFKYRELTTPDISATVKLSSEKAKHSVRSGRKAAGLSTRWPGCRRKVSVCPASYF